MTVVVGLVAVVVMLLVVGISGCKDVGLGGSVGGDWGQVAVVVVVMGLGGSGGGGDGARWL